MKGTTTAKRVDLWAQSPPVGIAIDRLEDIITQGIDKHILFIRFEDLTLYPENELNKIYDFLEINRFQHNFKNVEQVTFEDDTVHGIFGDHTIRKEIKPVYKQHNKYLGVELSQNIVNTYPWFYEYFNYNI